MLSFTRLHLLILFIGFCLIQGAPVHTSDLDVRGVEDPIYERDFELEIARRAGPSKWLAGFRGIKRITKDAKGPHVFWSGKSQGKSVESDAKRHAEKVGGTTIAQNLRTAGVQPPPGGQRSPVVMKWWDLASKLKAQNAKGEAHVVLGSQVRKGSVWNRVELPALLENQKISSVLQVDRKTGGPIRKLKSRSRQSLDE